MRHTVIICTDTTTGDATIALITVPLGLYLAFTKEMCIVNEFYWQTKERRHNGDI